MLKNKNAFTLAEIMVTLGVLGVIAAMIIPSVSQNRPNKNKVLFKKAYYTAERMVYELVNDEDLYPTAAGKVGLDNTAAVSYLNSTYGSDSNSTSQKQKFCKLFARKVNTNSESSIYCDSTHSNPANSTTPSFTTTDGIAWYMPISNFSNAINSPVSIYVDINGNNGVNCRYDSSTCKNPDTFTIKVYADGKMTVTGSLEKEYLSSNESVK